MNTGHNTFAENPSQNAQHQAYLLNKATGWECLAALNLLSGSLSAMSLLVLPVMSITFNRRLFTAVEFPSLVSSVVCLWSCFHLQLACIMCINRYTKELSFPCGIGPNNAALFFMEWCVCPILLPSCLGYLSKPVMCFCAAHRVGGFPQAEQQSLYW